MGKEHETRNKCQVGHTPHRAETCRFAAADTYAAAVHFQQILQGNAHLLFDSARVIHVPRDTEELGPSVVRASERIEPAGPAAQNRGGYSNGLNIRHSGRTSVEANIRWEWRLQARFALAALQTATCGGKWRKVEESAKQGEGGKGGGLDEKASQGKWTMHRSVHQYVAAISK